MEMMPQHSNYPSRLAMAARLAKEVVRDHFRQYWGLNGLDRRLAQLMPYRNGYYVELGANDGRTQSNTLHFERHKGWKGLLVEPSPTAFQHCVMTRSPRNSIVCACCVEPELSGTLIPMEYFNLKTTRTDRNPDQDLAVALPELRQNVGGEPDLAFRFGSEGHTLTELLDLVSAPSLIDFLSLDVEGNEINVLRGLDLSAYKFRYLLIESRRPEVIGGYLSENGYMLAERLSHHDYLFSTR
jgi:FkbM family methyltransferase